MPRPSDRARLIWPLLAALVGVAVYANVPLNGFALDDLPLVRDNPDLRSPAEIPRLLLRPYWGESAAASGLYRPVTIVSLNLNRTLTGPAAAGFHIVNVLLHGLACALVWWVVRGAGRHYGTALLAALLFAVHPLHVEAVANIAGRAELLAAVGVLGAWLAHRRAVAAEGDGTGWAVLAAVLYLLALLSKEGALLAPLVFLVEATLANRGALRRLTRPAVLYGAALLAAAALRIAALGGLRGAQTAVYLDNPAAFGAAWVRVATASWVQLLYVSRFVWPARLSSDYSYAAVPPVEHLGDPRLLAALLFALAGVAAMVLAWRRSPPVALGLACWALLLLPASNLVFPAGTLMAERLVYLPLLGGCLIAGHAGAALAGRARGRSRFVAAVVALCALLLILAATRSWVRTPVWRDNATLALHDVEVRPRSAKLQAGAGIVLHDRGELERAEAHYREALLIWPDYAQIHYNLGELLLSRGESAEALVHLRRATEIAPLNPLPYRTLAELHEREGRREASLAVRLDHGRALARLGRTAQARELLGALARDDPRGPHGGLALALVQELDGNVAGAVRIYRELLRRGGLDDDSRAVVERRLAELAPPGG